LRLIRDKTNINFVHAGRVCSWVSLVLTLLSLVLIPMRGINLGIDFGGGIMVEFHCSNASIADIRSAIGKDGAVVYATSANNFVIKGGARGGSLDSIKQALGSVCGEVEYRRASYVGPQVGRDMIFKSLGAIVLALLGVVAYLCVRFNLYFAISGIVTLAHDVVMLFGFYALTGLEFNLSSVAAVLTVVGYSINDSVIIYDRIRDYLKVVGRPHLEDVINDSINSTLSRTLFTSLTTLMAAAVLVLVGGEAIRTFSWAILFGIAVGTYSSIMISSQCVLWGRGVGYFKMQ
jgi:preprotein translocase subunit SecF